MQYKLFFVLGLVLFAAGIARADEHSDFEDNQNDETKTFENREETAKDEPKMIMQDMKTKTSTALVQQDDPDSIRNKGLCHWGISVWYKPGFAIRCNCLKCKCQAGGNWACAFEFAYCPYYYCGNQIYNPGTQLCCCGKVYNKKANHACCGYFYYDTRVSKCCNYYSVKPRKANCPRYRI